MSTSVDQTVISVAPLPRYREILLAVDSSDHANRGVEDGIALAQLSGARVTAAHVYAAKMHDMRFRQMEGGLPERFREEQELERQRDVHNDLITRGLSIIADSYLDQVNRACNTAGLRFVRRNLEGKNYRQLSKEANSGSYDLLVLGALGLGAVAESRLGTVCERVVRRAGIDTLVIKSPAQRIAAGPIAVAIDGSARAYGGLLTALALAQEWQVPVHVVSAFDPYYHYVAFNRIAGVLSEEAGKVFRFKEQERLHEEIIDSGLAKIYAGHLQIARDIAADYAIPIETKLLDGKPYDVIGRYLRDLHPSLLVIGKLGIHADPELDIGGNAENLLRNAPCAVLLSQREFIPRVERIAEVTVSWTHEARERVQRAPSFVQNMARMAILRYAQERGHTVITERIVEEATAALMPVRAEQAMAEIVAAHDAGELRRGEVAAAMAWSEAAQTQLNEIGDASLRDNVRLRSEKKARGERAAAVAPAHVAAFLDSAAAPCATEPERDPASGPDSLHWDAGALARLARVPEGFMREASRQRIESHARQQGANTVTLDLAERGLAIARAVMAEEVAADDGDVAAPKSQRRKCPCSQTVSPLPAEVTDAPAPAWTAEAAARLQEVPAGFCRTLTERAVDTLALQNNLHHVDIEFMEQVLKVFKNGSRSVATTMSWEADARARIERAPDAVRGMLIKEIETWARRHGLAEVDERAVRAIKREWQARGVFHLEPGDPRGDA
ncbi:MAG: universal stress protein [Sulfuricaulis sp.]|uniref:universal stress protein n=1 Tax=Sulfuricaulis sp. TaxID=2003553 RepID=UPI0034A5BBEF